MTGRVTMLGISRWTESGGSYRTIQRFFVENINWSSLNFFLFMQYIYEEQEVYLIAGDTTTVSKSGKETYGLGRYFSSIYNRAVPGLSFETLSLVGVNTRKSFPIIVEQRVRKEKQEVVDKPKLKAGRPKGSRNKNSENIELSEGKVWLKGLLQKMLKLMKGKMKATYFLYDNALASNEMVIMLEQLELHFISKLKCNSALWFPYKGEYSGRGAPRIYGDKVDYKNLPKAYLKETKTEEDIEIKTYQMKVRHKLFFNPLNVVIIRKKNLQTNKTKQIILFSSDLELAWDKIIDYYSLRFQIEFNFRDAKQHWGLEDFMNVGQQQVHNAANLALFMVNLSYTLTLQDSMTTLDLKTWFRAGKYVRHALKSLPDSVDDNFISQITNQCARLGRIHNPIMRV
jgi:putative transposase